jgi:hypothetical protein
MCVAVLLSSFCISVPALALPVLPAACRSTARTSRLWATTMNGTCWRGPSSSSRPASPSCITSASSLERMTLSLWSTRKWDATSTATPSAWRRLSRKLRDPLCGCAATPHRSLFLFFSCHMACTTLSSTLFLSSMFALKTLPSLLFFPHAFPQVRFIGLLRAYAASLYAFFLLIFCMPLRLLWMATWTCLLAACQVGCMVHGLPW